MIDDAYMRGLIQEDTLMSHWKRLHKNDGWKVKQFIKGYQRKYKISRCGLVLNCRTKSWLKPQQHKNGYLYVCLYQDGKRKNVYLHKLVAEHFTPNPMQFNCVYHLDGNKLNNRARNIAWISRSLLQRDIDPENPPMLTKRLKKLSNANRVSTCEISMSDRVKLDRMEEILNSMVEGSEEWKEYRWVIHEFWEDARNGIPIPDEVT